MNLSALSESGGIALAPIMLAMIALNRLVGPVPYRWGLIRAKESGVEATEGESLGAHRVSAACGRAVRRRGGDVEHRGNHSGSLGAVQHLSYNLEQMIGEIRFFDQAQLAG